ncbi:MAG TPA: type II secretion system protein N [Burkholderiaceae bacterium]|nr:type II secretion system protein N [Burkholderiaceae bacterium]
MRGLMLWCGTGVLAVVLTVLAFLPATWLSVLVERQTGGRLALGDAQGTLWRGSAFIGGAPGGGDPLTPLLPGRFSWRLSPALLLGRVDAEFQNPAALSAALQIDGSWSEWRFSPAAVMLPAQRLTGLGAPLNTIQPSGQMRLSWNRLQLTRHGQRVDLQGSLLLEMMNIASRLSPIKPLGVYRLTIDWHGQSAQMQLKTDRGPMLLSGSGSIQSGGFNFSGRAEAAPGEEERLANLLNLLGQRRAEDGKNFIALEFRQ